jgi:hypothetical protein
MAYMDVTFIVDGAVDSGMTYEWPAESENYSRDVAEFERDCNREGVQGEIYELLHDHEPMECECAQFVTDGHPAYTVGITEGA